MASLEITPPLTSIETFNTTTATSSSPSFTTHVVLLPFMSKGHTIPIIHLAHLLLNRNITVTVFTTPANSPFIRSFLTHTTAKVLELPFPQTPDTNIPPGVESTDKLPSMSLFLPFVQATKLLQPHFEEALSTVLPHVSCIIRDGFLSWAQLSASKVDVPCLVFYGMNAFSMTVPRLVAQHRPHKDVESDDELFSVPFFPSVKLSKRDLVEPFNDPEPKGPLFDFVVECGIATSKSRGIVVNSFYELESVYVDFYNREFGNPRAWCVGPLCIASPLERKPAKPRWVQWLDERKAMERPVLYVAFGTQAEISETQLKEIGIGLERSGVDYLWVVRGKEVGDELGDGFEETGGMVVREWVEQREILEHETVRGFLSHGGWNSVLESICAEVPVLAWPMMAEQHMNAKMIVEELGIGLRVKEGGRGDEVVGWERVKEMVVELMVGEKGKEVGKKVKELGEKAKRAVEEGGSSWCSLNLMLDEVFRNCKIF